MIRLAAAVPEEIASMSPDLSDEPGREASGRPLVDHLAEYLARPEVVEQMRPVFALVRQALETWAAMFQLAGAIAQRAEESCPSTAYKPLLIENGVSPLLAGGLASLAIRIGTRRADESRRLPAVADAVRFLAEPRRRRADAILRRAEVLLAASRETSIVETIFHDAHLVDSEFIGLLESVVEGREVDCLRIREIAAAVAPHLSVSRGRKVSEASATHDHFLGTVAGLLGPRAYSRDAYKEDYTDPWTKATRQEFGDQDFDPQAAHRRAKARRMATEKPAPALRRTA